jgi:hypothetical protein
MRREKGGLMEIGRDAIDVGIVVRGGAAVRFYENTLGLALTEPAGPHVLDGAEMRRRHGVRGPAR